MTEITCAVHLRVGGVGQVEAALGPISCSDQRHSAADDQRHYRQTGSAQRTTLATRLITAGLRQQQAKPSYVGGACGGFRVETWRRASP